MTPGRVGIVGLGLIGGSLGLALGARGWDVVGLDADPDRGRQALELGVVREVATTIDALAAGVDLVVVATPVGHVAAAVQAALDAGAPLVTDVGSVKAAIADAVTDPRFVPGHPMAGSEQEGLAGARADLFASAVWVLTPHAGTDDDALTAVRAVAASLDADVVTIEPVHHDALVAVVSHVPHLTAVTLMRLADERSVEHRALLRLAAGGFRDMTRIAAGHPGIWPDICVQNRDAIVTVLDDLVRELAAVRDLVVAGDRGGLLGHLEQARRARLNLPTGVPRDVRLAELRVPVFDRPGELARLLTLATEIDVNVYDLEIAHSSEGKQGVAIMVVQQVIGERFVGALMANGYRPVLTALDPEP